MQLIMIGNVLHLSPAPDFYEVSFTFNPSECKMESHARAGTPARTFADALPCVGRLLSAKRVFLFLT